MQATIKTRNHIIRMCNIVYFNYFGELKFKSNYKIYLSVETK